MMIRDGDPASPSNYAAIRGVLQGVGHHVQVYVAAEDVEKVTRNVLEDVITTFDDVVFPAASSRLGVPHDVDGDGRFTILFSSWLDHLGDGRHAVDGFVKVADLDPSAPCAFGNRCDMIYLNAGLRSGLYLRTVLAHEYMHAVVYTRKTLDHADAGGPGPEEEGWLDEALAHMAEDFHGFSSANIDYRISAFLSQPQSYQLVVDDYFAADLFRSHGNRGSTYLFLRWCVDRYGPDLVPALVHSPLRGVASLEAATGSTFLDLYRRWSLAVYSSGMDSNDGMPAKAVDGFDSTNLRAPLAEWELAGPRFARVTTGGPPERWDQAGTSSRYVVVVGGDAGAAEIDVEGPPGAEIQVTAMPLGAGHARLALSLRPRQGPDGELRVGVRIAELNGTAVRLSGLSWEPLVPGPRPNSDGSRCRRLDMLGIAAAFGTSDLPARGELKAQSFHFDGVTPHSGPIVVKIIGTDLNGRRVTAWADLNVSTNPSVGCP